MSKNLDRRDFFLHIAPLIAAPGFFLGSAFDTEAQIRNMALRTPSNNSQFNVGDRVVISMASLRINSPRIRRIDFKSNGQSIGSSSARPFSITWVPAQPGSFQILAEAVLENGSVIMAAPVNVTIIRPRFEVLHDTLGNATDGWGWAGQPSYLAGFLDALGTNYIIVTCFTGTLANPKRLRTLEIAINGINFGLDACTSVSQFADRFYLGIWRTDQSTFFQSPLGGSVSRANLPRPSLGSLDTPAGTFADGNGNPCNVYVTGWDTLDVLLPANVEIQIACYAENIDYGGSNADSIGIFASSLPGPPMLLASSDSGNFTLGQPSAARLRVSQ